MDELVDALDLDEHAKREQADKRKAAAEQNGEEEDMEDPSVPFAHHAAGC